MLFMLFIFLHEYEVVHPLTQTKFTRKLLTQVLEKGNAFG